jgi:hypothetical protein
MKKLKLNLPIILLLASVLSIANIAGFAQSQNTEVGNVQTNDFENNQNLVRIFRLINSLNKEADKQQSKGFPKRAEMVRNYFQKKTSVTPDARLKLNELAVNFQKERERLNSAIKEILKIQKDKPNDSALISELEKLRESRNKLYDYSRKSLVDSLTKDDFERTLRFLREEIIGKSKKIDKPKSIKKQIGNAVWFNNISYNISSVEDEVSGYSYLDYDPGSGELWGGAVTEGLCEAYSGDGEHEWGCRGAWAYAEITSAAGDIIASESADNVGDSAEVYIYGSVFNGAPLEDGQYCIYGEHAVETNHDYQMIYASSSACEDVEIIPEINKIQYQDPNTSDYIDIDGALYVLKGTTVNFRGASADNEPIAGSWSGTSGASGTGESKSVIFNNISTSLTDYKTVIVGNEVSQRAANVIVYELTGTLTPQDNFSGRSQDKYGITEKVNLGFNSTPNLTASQIGSLTWKIIAGTGTLNNTTTGQDEYTAPKTAGALSLKLEIQTGPSKNLGPVFERNVVVPSGAYMVKSTEVPGIRHCQGYSSVGFYGDVRLEPKDVSFANLFFREGGGEIHANGIYASDNGKSHDPTPFMTAVNDCNITSGCKAFFDQVWTGKWAPHPTLGFIPGTSTVDIEWLYAFSVDSNPAYNGQTIFTYATHLDQSDNVGTATTQKAGAGPYTKTVNEPDEGCSDN